MTTPAFLKKYTSFLRRPKGGGRTEPGRDWLVLLVLFLILLAGSLVWNILFFSEALSEKEASAPLEEGAAADTSSVLRVHEAFERRALEEEKYRNEYRFVDPS